MNQPLFFKPWPELQEKLPKISRGKRDALHKNIEEHGVLENGVALPDGTIIDGVHRFEFSNGEMKFNVVDLDREIAFALGIALNVARRQMSAEQIRELQETLRKDKEKQRKVALELRKQGRTQEEVAAIIGVTRQTIDNWEDIPNAKICISYIPSTPDLKVRISKNERPKIYERFIAGETQTSIAADYEVSQPTISRNIKKHEHDLEREKLKEDIKNLKVPEGKFNIIVIDPPWPYGTNYDPDTRRVASPYPEMSLKEIEEIEIPADENCILWLWTTNRFIHDGFHLIEKWEFKPKTILTWIKDKMGIGQWLRGKTEHCILATKGKPPINLTNQTTALFGTRTKHSRKPIEFYELVDSLCFGRKLDYFSRESREGWETFGTMELEDSK